MKLLAALFDNIPESFISEYSKISINSIITDNRKINHNDLFVALKGTRTDSHDYIKDAIDRGAVAVVCEYIPQDCPQPFPYIVVKNSREILGKIASAYYGHPSKQLKLVGVTGTNGKTTVCTLLYNLFTEAGFPTGLISTVQNIIGKEVTESTHTTPDPVSLNALLSQMVLRGCSHCFMEVSSHAIDQNRISGLQYQGAVFTNITHDHLDYHKTFAHYLKTKKLFFDNLSEEAFALTNKDDKNGTVMLQNTRAVRYSYSLRSVSDFKGKIIESDLTGMLLDIDGVQAWFGLAGEFNASNLLAVYGTAFLLGLKKDEIITLLSKVRGAKGRFEVIVSPEGVVGIIDYAHTPDALKNVLETIAQARTRNETLFTIMGCGGDRDKEKRPAMGQIAALLSDKVVLTSDNPRSENPENIISEIRAGIQSPLQNKVLKITNRDEAIHAVVSMAKKGDIILLAGKGHETYQEINGIKHPFDDYEILKHAFNTL